MFSIKRIQDKSSANRIFHISSKNSLEYCAYHITIFGRTFQITYSSKLNYFYIAQQARRERLLNDALCLAFIRHIIPSETNKKLTSLERITTSGRSGDFYLRGVLDGQDVFMKVTLTRVETDSGTGGAMENEYDKFVTLSQECRYIAKPIHYIQCLPCEILILPYIQDLRTLSSVLADDAPAPSWLKEQLLELIEFLKSKRLIHRDINAGNLAIGRLENGDMQLFLNDLAYMTYLDDNGRPVPTNVEKKVNKDRPPLKQNDAEMFRRILDALDAKLAQDITK